MTDNKYVSTLFLCCISLPVPIVASPQHVTRQVGRLTTSYARVPFQFLLSDSMSDLPRIGRSFKLIVMMMRGDGENDKMAIVAKQC